MCTVSMIVDQWQEKWRIPPYSPPVFYPPTPPSQAEIDEFRELLKKARKWDREHGQPDCEMDSKIQKLRDLAEELGIADEIDIVLKEELNNERNTSEEGGAVGIEAITKASRKRSPAS